MTIVAPLYIETAGVSTSLVLVNNSESNVGTQITLFDASGLSVAGSHVNLTPHQQRVIELSTILENSKLPYEVGSVSISQDKAIKSKSIAAQLEIKNERGGTLTYVDEEFSMPITGLGSSSLRGVTDKSDGPPLVSVLNTSEKPQKVSVRCITDRAESESSALIQPNGLTLLQGCHTVSASRYFDEMGQGVEALSGIEIVGEGGSGSLAAFAVVPHATKGSTVFTGAAFSDPSSVNSSSTIFAGVPFGSSALLPEGRYTPTISLANFSPHPAQVSVSQADSQGLGVKDAKAGGENVVQQVRTVTVPPGRTVELTLRGSGTEPGLLHSVQVTSDRSPGEVLAKLESKGDGSLFTVELLGKDEADINNSGMHPWSLEGEDQSTLLLFNHSPKEQIFDVSIYADSILWEKKYRLAPQQTRQFSFREIIDQKVVDDYGHTLSSARSGTINWMVPDSAKSTGRVLVTNRTESLARNYSCGNFTTLCGLTISTYNSDAIPLSIVLQGYSGIPQFCNSYSPSQCNGNSTGGGSATVTNTVSPTNIVRLNSSADTSSTSPNLYGVSDGNGSAYFSAQAGQCQASGSPNPEPVTTGIKLSLVSVDCSETHSSGVIHGGWGQNGLSGCLLSENQPTNTSLPLGGTCSSNSTYYQVYKYVKSNFRGNITYAYAYPIVTRTANNECTKFIDNVTYGINTTSMNP